MKCTCYGCWFQYTCKGCHCHTCTRCELEDVTIVDVDDEHRHCAECDAEERALSSIEKLKNMMRQAVGGDR